MDDPSPTGSWYYRFRKQRDRRSFFIALGVSGVLHLSMVTVFSIVIYFPRQDTEYYEFAIVPVSSPVVEAAPDESSEPPGESGRPPEDRLALRRGDDGSTRLPALDLPTVEFAELERLRVRQEGMASLSRYDDIFQRPAEDSWARFSRGLSGVSRSLSKLSLSGSSEDGELTAPFPNLEGVPEPIVHRPAEGFEANLVWSTEPRTRKLLFAPPIEALWQAGDADLLRPIEIVLQVNALGRVVNVFSPNVDDRELVDAVQMTALRYRFEPLDLDEGADQTATLRIQREPSGAGP